MTTNTIPTRAEIFSHLPPLYTIRHDIIRDKGEPPGEPPGGSPRGGVGGSALRAWPSGGEPSIDIRKP